MRQVDAIAYAGGLCYSFVIIILSTKAAFHIIRDAITNQWTKKQMKKYEEELFGKKIEEMQNDFS